MKPVFTLSLPRSRTAWLTMYLNGNGVNAFHDLWRFVKTPAELKKFLESSKSDVVVSCDTANIFFYEELRAEFPDARFVKIIRNIDDVKESMALSYGEAVDDLLLKVNDRLLSAEADFVIEYEEWTEARSYELFQFLTGGPPDLVWHLMAHEFNVQVTEQRISDDLAMFRSGMLSHINEKVRG